MKTRLNFLTKSAKCALLLPLMILGLASCDSDEKHELSNTNPPSEEIDHTDDGEVNEVEYIYDCDDPRTPPTIAHYPLNGNAEDYSSFGNDGEIKGAAKTSDRFGNSKQALYFNGLDNSVEAPDQEQLYLNDEMTVSAWVYPEDIKTQYIVRKGTHVNGEFKTPFALGLSGTNAVVFTLTTDNNQLVQARIQGYQKNTWMLVTGVFKDQEIFLYVNGALVAQNEVSGRLVNDPFPLIIGTHINISSGSFKGKIDDVKIWDFALCEEDIFELYQEN